MFHFLNKIFGSMPTLALPAPPPFSEAAMESAREAASMGSVITPTFSEEDLEAVLNAIGRALEEPVKTSNRGRKPGTPSLSLRKYAFHDLDIGQSCRMPNSASNNPRQAAYMYGIRTGRVFTTRSKANGLWIKRVA